VLVHEQSFSPNQSHTASEPESQAPSGERPSKQSEPNQHLLARVRPCHPLCGPFPPPSARSNKLGPAIPCSKLGAGTAACTSWWRFRPNGLAHNRSTLPLARTDRWRRPVGACCRISHREISGSAKEFAACREARST